MTDGLDLLPQDPIIELELLVGGQKSNLGHDEELENEGFAYSSHQARFVLKHALGYLTEQVGLLS